jgi:hypothetical protein
MHFLHIEDNDIVNKIRPSNSWDFGNIKPHNDYFEMKYFSNKQNNKVIYIFLPQYCKM